MACGTRAGPAISARRAVHALLCLAALGQLLAPSVCRSTLGTHTNSASVSPEVASSTCVSAIGATHSGYIPVNQALGSQMYYAYYETASAASTVSLDSTPILLWLQGGPGCASTFGGFYELGPYSVVNSSCVVPNPGSWAAGYGLLLVDQPIGTGYSVVGQDAIPADEMGVADHLYRVLHGFFARYPALQTRPFFITGESYGGKYVPSIGHYILQAAQQQQQQQPLAQAAARSLSPKGVLPAAAVASSLQHHRALPQGTPPPNFRLAGLAIGNGLTSPRKQTAVIADVAFAMGLVSEAGRQQLQRQQEVVLRLIDQEQWLDAHHQRSRLLEMVVNLTGIATMLDMRRVVDYDAGHHVDAFLNQGWVKAALGARPDVEYASCSEEVDRSMQGDVMRGVEHLLPDILQHFPVLLYQGQFDLQDGVASNEAWLEDLDWPGRDELNAQSTSLWRVDGAVAGWVREARGLRHVMVRNAGHMVPHDQPRAVVAMMRDWVASCAAKGAQGSGGSLPT